MPVKMIKSGEISAQTQTTIVEVKSMVSGMYLYRLVSGETILSAGKLLITH